jgi:hypothetical protein
MNKTILLFVACAMISNIAALANPRPCWEIREIQAIPPRIGLFACDSLDISGDTIFTSSGFAVVNQGVIVPPYFDNIFYLDSTNTSGFVLNQESDFINLDLDEYMNPVIWGTSGRDPVPINGHTIDLKLYSAHFSMEYVFSFDFTNPLQGGTEVVLNEINAHSTWNSGSGFIELYNRGDSYTNLDNWKLVCDTILTLPQGATIPPHGFYVIDQSQFPPSWDMDSTGDNIYLINSANQTVDQVGWSSDHGADVSFMRFPDGAVDTTGFYDDFWGFDDASSVSFSDGYPSRGSYNSVDSPGLRVIGIRADTSNGSILIQWTNPVWLSVFSQVILRRSLEIFPATPFDGDLIYEGVDQQYLDRDITPGQRYYYTAFARSSCGEYSQPDSQSQISIIYPSQGIGSEPLPEKPALLSAYPNPFNGLITLTLTGDNSPSIIIYDITGSRIDELPLTGGRGIWDAREYSSGIYFARTLSEKAIKPIKLIYLK